MFNLLAASSTKLAPGEIKETSRSLSFGCERALGAGFGLHFGLHFGVFSTAARLRVACAAPRARVRCVGQCFCSANVHV